MTQPTVAESRLTDGKGNPLLNARQPAVADVTGTAGGTYTATEQGLINDLIADNTLFKAVIRKHGLMED